MRVFWHGVYKSATQPFQSKHYRETIKFCYTVEFFGMISLICNMLQQFNYCVITGVKSDALGIYTTYISLNAINNVKIDDQLRQHIEGIVTCNEAMTTMNTHILSVHSHYMSRRWCSKKRLF